MTLIPLVVVGLLIGYCFLMGYYSYGWWSEKAGSLPVSDPTVQITVIIPARNESANITKCLDALMYQDYPTAFWEVIIVNDFSDDNTTELVKQHPLSNLRLIDMSEALQVGMANTPKKAAIRAGISMAAGTLILTTDADCIPGKKWISTMAGYYRNGFTKMIVGPVTFSHIGGILSAFQCLDFLALQAITAASHALGMHVMCNGANLAYTRSAFEEVGGFDSKDQLASGDDMLLLQKFRNRFPDDIVYAKNKDAIVRTHPETTLKKFISQRIRWASKARYYKSYFLFLVLLLVLVFNISLVVLMIGSLFSADLLEWAVASLLIKTIIELPLMFGSASFYGQQNLLWWFPFFQPLHCVYTSISGIFSQFGKYEWKGRKLH